MHRRLLAVATTLFLSADIAPAAEGGWSREKKLVVANAVAAGGILAWGAFAWDYGEKSFSFGNEGWFGRNTEYGGADKTGHAFTAYATGRGFSHAYQSWGYERERAALYGALTSVGLTGLIEIGDGFSDFGTSYEDQVVNTVGAAASWMLHRSPELQERLAFRIEWEPAFEQADITTDYERLKYSAVLRLGGFEALQGSPLRWLELHAGYYTRGYDDGGDRERNVFVGIGIDFARLLHQAGWEKTGTFLNYYQPPYTTLQQPFELND